MRKIVLLGNLQSKNFSNHLAEFHKIALKFQEQGIKTELFTSLVLADSRRFILKSIENGIREFITIGGDGSLHFLVNELMNQDQALFTEFKVGILPLGTGNDYFKNFNFKSTECVVNSVANSKTMLVDIGQFTFQNGNKRYFINLAGIGFNGAVIQQINKFKWMGNISYYIALIYCFIFFKPDELTVKIDDILYEKNTFLLSLGIGKSAGGGMILCPNAIINDGLFEVNIIPKISWWKFLLNIPRLHDGSYLKNFECTSLQAKKVEIIQNKTLQIEADGEYLDQQVKSIEILEKKMTVYC